MKLKPNSAAPSPFLLNRKTPPSLLKGKVASPPLSLRLAMPRERRLCLFLLLIKSRGRFKEKGMLSKGSAMPHFPRPPPPPLPGLQSSEATPTY